MRGISPVVATILMVVIAIAAAVVAYSWFTSVQGSLQAKASQHVSSVSGIMFTIVDAFCIEKTVFVWISNLSDDNVDANAWAALLDAEGAVLDVAEDVRVVVPAHDINYAIATFNKYCENGKYIMLTIDASSAVAPYKVITQQDVTVPPPFEPSPTPIPLEPG